ncbi:M3 family oligoendopeptidase [Periweissella beninensis]|uniref:M3 family oligoendopeptidase n=1 Tax=Periweissella beninensis TaxID=504936 RepID=UPI0021A5AFF6|nr:M3 family oligoendopeptidase [Periweissella beninensis]MCT4396726.1 M3 family oligoendopeptidase [Periweissella beninensis]
MAYSQNWNLENIFAGGISSPTLKKKLLLITDQTADFSQKITNYNLSNDQPNYQNFIDLTTLAQKIEAGLLQASVFVNALISDDFSNTTLSAKAAKINVLKATYAQPLGKFKQLLAKIEPNSWAIILKLPTIKPIAFALTEMRQQAVELLDDNTENLLKQLELDGLSAWSSHYDTIAASLTMPFTDANNQTTTISAGQALNHLEGYPDAAVREKLLTNYENMWAQAEGLVADTLNHLAGFRLTEYASHNIKDFLQKPLALNRMSKATLDAMWQTVSANKSILVPYFERKAQLIGKKKLGFQDIYAPIKVPGYQAPTITYDYAAKFIITNFEQFSPKMASLARKAFENRWIEAENRPGKQPGGYMESVPELGESRIFLTFTGSPNDASTIAHELGHAFHSSVLTDLPFWRGNYAMNVAETASTFAELVVNDAKVQEAKNVAEKLTLLDAKLNNPVAMLMNIHARYLFEISFYKARQDHLVSPDELNNLMLNAQKTAFADSLDKYHPHFWASKLHFYIDDIPFYNFPYTFGYLFSLGIYALAKKTGDFEEQYIALLRDTANMSTEELAKKHLGVDLTKPDFWQAAIDIIAQDINEFLTLSEQFI